jgi:hypothetical protein
MKTSDLIETIKTLALEQMMNAGSASAGKMTIRPPQGTPSPPPPAAAPLGATFGGKTTAVPNSGSTAADKLKAIDAGKFQSAPRVDGMQGRVANPPLNTTNNTQVGGGGINANAGRTSVSKPATVATQSTNPRASNYKSTVAQTPAIAPKPASSLASDARAMETRNRTAQALRSTQNAVISAVDKQKQVASTSQTKPTTTTSKPTQKSVIARKSKPVARPSARPSKGKWGFGAGSGSQDAGSITNRALGGVNESLLNEIKCIAKKKNTKKSKDGDDPKGTPDQVEINPTIFGSFSNR